MNSDNNLHKPVPKITIVVGTLNRPKTVVSIIDQIDKISLALSIELIVYDQSSDANKRILKQNFPKKSNFHLISMHEPNTCKYLNLGWHKASAPIVLYLDDDVNISKDTILAHIKAYKIKKINAVAGRVINNNERATTDCRVGKIYWSGAIITKNFSYDKERFVDFPYGCNMSFRKEILEKVGGFDERLSRPIYAYNEIELGYRISKRWKSSFIFIPDALVYHNQAKEGGTRNDFTSFEIYYCTQFNFGYFIAKDFSILENIFFIIRRFCYQIISEPRAIPIIIKGFVYGKRSKYLLKFRMNK